MPERPHRVARLVGVLGGMGPSATVDFYDKLVRNTPVKRDQDHLRVVIWADPTVPSRQDALLRGGADPTPWLEEGVGRLIDAGVEILVSPCNTVHTYLTPLMVGAPVEFISIVDATVEAIRSRKVRQVGLLATDGALVSGLFQTALDAAGISWVIPPEVDQAQMMSLVDAVKIGSQGSFLGEQLEAALFGLQARGVDVVVAGCTELSTLLSDRDRNSGLEVIDPALELALKVIERGWDGRHG